MTYTAETQLVGGSRWTDDLIENAMSGVPFYRSHLAQAESSRLESVPSFDKTMTAGYGRFPLSSTTATGAYRVFTTSGTTGRRICAAFDDEDWDRVGTWLARVGGHADLGPRDLLLNTHCYGLWVGGPALDLLALRSGAGLLALGPVGPSTIFPFLAEGIGTAISATPSYLRRLVEAAEVSNFDLAQTGLRAGFIGAESAEPSLRRKILQRLPKGFLWIELYGLTETGGPSVAFGDPAVPELTLNTGDFCVEVLELDADVPVAVGAVGEITLTTRNPRCRTPLIRYRTRDVARVLAEESGRPTRVSPLLGRADDALKVAGVLVYPSAVAEVVSSLLPATAEWRALLQMDGPEESLAVQAEADSASCQAIECAFADRLGLGVSVTPVPPGSLVRTKEKSRRILVHYDGRHGAHHLGSSGDDVG